jgi:F1F0 ATPase subunit 2
MTMMLEATWPYLVGCVGGVGLGFFYFGGLWLTVKKIPASTSPERLLLWSAVGRLAPTLVVLFLALRVDPGIFVIMLLGFFAVRHFMTRRVATTGREQIDAA